MITKSNQKISLLCLSTNFHQNCSNNGRVFASQTDTQTICKIVGFKLRPHFVRQLCLLLDTGSVLHQVLELPLHNIEIFLCFGAFALLQPQLSLERLLLLVRLVHILGDLLGQGFVRDVELVVLLLIVDVRFGIRPSGLNRGRFD